MDELSGFERRLAGGLEEYVGPRRTVDAVAVARTAAASSTPWRATLLGSGRVPWRLMGAVALLAVSLAAGAVFVGSQQSQRPWSDFLVAYESGGDIHVGDPVTGRTTAITEGPEDDNNPRFSPDGTRIAFIRGDALESSLAQPGEASIVVIGADGSDPLTITPDGWGPFHDFLAWTPDSSAVVVNYQYGLAMLDATRVAPRVLTPPLPRWHGAGYFNANAEVAPMFKPPNGDVILSYDGNRLDAFDADLVTRTQIGREALEPFERYVPMWPTWSPDGTKIFFGLDRAFGTTTVGQYGTYVINADGTGLRRIATDVWDRSAVWSPDGSKIAFERGLTVGECPESDRAVIVIVDVATGSERVLEATHSERKPEECPTGSGGWFYKGWSWTTDGGRIAFLEQSGTKPKVVDVETGEAAELPWEADSAPSWQRRPAD